MKKIIYLLLIFQLAASAATIEKIIVITLKNGQKLEESRPFDGVISQREAFLKMVKLGYIQDDYKSIYEDNPTIKRMEIESFYLIENIRPDAISSHYWLIGCTYPNKSLGALLAIDGNGEFIGQVNFRSKNKIKILKKKQIEDLIKKRYKKVIINIKRIHFDDGRGQIPLLSWTYIVELRSSVSICVKVPRIEEARRKRNGRYFTVRKVKSYRIEKSNRRFILVNPFVETGKMRQNYKPRIWKTMLMVPGTKMEWRQFICKKRKGSPKRWFRVDSVENE